MTVFFDKGFREQGAVAIAALEVVGQAPQAQPEGLGGQVAAGDGRSDQEAAQSDHAVQLAAAQVGVPADEGITRGQRQGRGGEAQRAQHAVVGNQQVAQLGAHVPGRAARMLALQQLVPDPPLVLPDDLDQRQPLDEVGPRGHVRRGGHGPTETARLAGPAPVAGRGQLDAAVPIEGAQRLHAAGQLGPAAGVMESERLTDPTAHLGPAGGAGLSQQVLQPIHPVGAGECGSNLILLVHAQGMAQDKYKGQVLLYGATAGRACRSRQPVAVSRQLAGLAPPGQRYGYDEIVWVGLAHYQRHLQREEIRAALARQGLALSAGSVSALCDRGRRTGRGYRPDARPASASYLISITCTVSNSNMTKSGEDQQVKQIHVADEIERRDDPVPTVILERDGVQYRVFFVVAPDDLCYYFHQPLRRAGD